MSDLENSACTGSCDTCGSDCNLDLSNPNATVTLTLDDDSELDLCRPDHLPCRRA